MGPDHSVHDGGGQRKASRRAVRPVRVLLLALPALILLSGCSMNSDNAFMRMALPPAASDRSGPMFGLWFGAWIASAVVFLLVFGLILWSAIRYRRRSDDEIPPQLRYHLPIEVLYTITPVIVVAVFFFHTVVAQNDMLKKVKDPDHTITVVGSQWQWTFDYIGEDATGGKPVFDYGTPNDFAELWLPVGESVRFKLKSPDVIHSFWVPEFYFKLDVFPGKVNTFDMTPTRKGVFTGRCAELCGVYHSRMLFKVHIVSPEKYDAHLRKLQQEGQVGTPEGAAEAMHIADGLEKNGAAQ